MKKLPLLIGLVGLLVAAGTLYANQPSITVGGLKVKSKPDSISKNLPIAPKLGREMTITASEGGTCIRFKDAPEVRSYKFHLEAWDGTVLPVTVFGHPDEDPVGFFPLFAPKFKGGRLVGVHREGGAPDIAWSVPDLATSSDMVSPNAPLLTSGAGVASAEAVYEELKNGDGYIRIHMKISYEAKKQARKQVVVRPAPFITPNYRTNGSMGTGTKPIQARIPDEIEVFVNTCVGAMPEIVEFPYELLDTWDTSDRNAKVLARGTLRLKPVRKQEDAR